MMKLALCVFWSLLIGDTQGVDKSNAGHYVVFEDERLDQELPAVMNKMKKRPKVRALKSGMSMMSGRTYSYGYDQNHDYEYPSYPTYHYYPPSTGSSMSMMSGRNYYGYGQYYPSYPSYHYPPTAGGGGYYYPPPVPPEGEDGYYDYGPGFHPGFYPGGYPGGYYYYYGGGYQYSGGYHYAGHYGAYPYGYHYGGTGNVPYPYYDHSYTPTPTTPTYPVYTDKSSMSSSMSSMMSSSMHSYRRLRGVAAE